MTNPEPQLELMQFTIATHHTISTGPYENIKVEASITCGIRRGTTDEQFKPIMQAAQTKLREILKETFIAQRLKRKGEQHGHENNVSVALVDAG